MPAKGGDGGKPQTGPLLSARACDLDVLWQRAMQLCDVSVQVRRAKGATALCSLCGLGCMHVRACCSCAVLCAVQGALRRLAANAPMHAPHPTMQHKENLRVTVEGANNGGLLSRVNGLSLFVPVSQLERKGPNEWWTEQVGAPRAGV